MGVGTLALGGPIAALLEGSEPTPIPHRIGATEIEQIRTATRVFESWSRNYGGGLAREAVMGQLRWSASLLQATCPDRLRPELYSTVGDLADMAGFMAVDANAHEEAGRVYRFALACAEQAKDWSLHAEVLSSTAKQAIWTGQPDDGLTLAELALVRSDWLTATVRSLLHTDRAPPHGAAAFHTRQTGGLPLWIGITLCGERVCRRLTPCSPTRLRLAAGRTVPHRFRLAARRTPTTHARSRGEAIAVGALPRRRALTPAQAHRRHHRHHPRSGPSPVRALRSRRRPHPHPRSDGGAVHARCPRYPHRDARPTRQHPHDRRDHNGHFKALTSGNIRYG